MTGSQKFSLFLLRISLGWLMFYAGITKVLNPEWSAAGYIAGAKTFTGFYDFFLNPGILPIVTFLNQWGILLIGIALLFGIAVRPAALSGVALMMLYYFPILDFPYPNAHSYIVEEHIIYALAFIVLGVFRAGRAWGLENWFSRSVVGSKIRKYRTWIG